MRDKEHTRNKKNDLKAGKLLGSEFEVRKKGHRGQIERQLSLSMLYHPHSTSLWP